MSGQTKADYKAKAEELQEAVEKLLEANDGYKAAHYKIEADLHDAQAALAICENTLESTRSKLKMIGDWINEASE